MGQEAYCTKHFVPTYNGNHLNGAKSMGGYALYNRTPGHFVFKIPDAIPLAEAAPMLCGGVTVWSPLKQNGCGPGKKVGIVGVGGLGHFAVLFAKALGADKVVAISRKASKAADALKLGADLYIATEDEPNWATTHARSLDLIISTVSSDKVRSLSSRQLRLSLTTPSTQMPLNDYLSLLRYGGSFIQVGLPDGGMLGLPVFTVLRSNLKVGGSFIGSPNEIREMLDFVAEKGIHPWVEQRSMKDANQAIVDMEKGKARYRYVLVNEQHL